MKIALVLTLLTLVSCKPTKTVDAEATTGNINVSAPYLWASNAFPKDLRISDSFTASEVANIQEMSNAWEISLKNKNFFTNTNRTPEVSSPTLNLDSLGSDGITGVYKIQNWPKSLSTGALAVTQIFGRRFNVGGPSEFVRIEHADILINEQLYNFRTDSSSVWGYDLRTVILHELGHFLGLGHKYGNTVMVPSISGDTESHTPTSIDINDMAAKYNIPLGKAGAAMVAGPQVNYEAPQGHTGEAIKILIEIHTDGECVHRENGVVTSRHHLR